MGHGHHHDHGHGHGHGHGASSTRRLAAVLALTLGFAVVEAIGGLLTGSLALLADAGHMLSDSGSLALALLAGWLAGHSETAVRTFGYKRAEVLAALANGVALVVIAVWILVEAGRRLSDPPEVMGPGMLAVAVGGLAVNLAGAAILARGDRDNVNVSAAMRHVIADLLGSAGAIVAALIIITTGWRQADPLVSAAIALLVLASAWPVLRDTLRILLEAAPRGLDAATVGGSMAEREGIVEVHDLHVWTITSGFPALSAHVLVGPGDDCHARRRELETLLRERFGIEHTTLQVDHVGDEEALLQIQSHSHAGAPGETGAAR